MPPNARDRALANSTVAQLVASPCKKASCPKRWQKSGYGEASTPIPDPPARLLPSASPPAPQKRCTTDGTSPDSSLRSTVTYSSYHPSILRPRPACWLP